VRAVREVPVSNKKIEVDRDEYEALCALRDHAHEKLKVDIMQLRENYGRVVAVNSEQLARLQSQDLALTHLRERLHEAQAEILKWKPATFDTLQPTLKKSPAMLASVNPVKDTLP